MVKKLLIDNPVVSRQVFYPQRRGVPTNLSSNIKVLKLQINKKVLIGGFFFENNVNLPTILLFHGNGEIAEDYYDSLDFFFDCGVNLAVIDYRGYGFSSGQPFYTSLLSDAFPIYNEFSDWINEYNIENSLFVLGRSLGSACASEIGAQNPSNLRGIIFSSGFASIYNMMTRLFRVSGEGINPEDLKPYSNDTRILKFKKPVLIIHGTQDFVIPYDESKIIFDSVPEGIDKKLVLIEKAGHNDIFLFRDKYITPLKQFIQKYK
jgi:pimeloyl-ACP methyl ester carboxylesterase